MHDTSLPAKTLRDSVNLRPRLRALALLGVALVSAAGWLLNHLSSNAINETLQDPPKLTRAEMALFKDQFALPQSISTDDISRLTTAEQADRILRAAISIYNFYSFSGFGARHSASADFKARIKELDNQWCDSAVAAMRLLLGDAISVENYNMIAPLQPLQIGKSEASNTLKSFGGHTVAHIRLERGAILVDPTYGIVLLTNQPQFTQDILASAEYLTFAITDFETDLVEGLAPWRALRLLQAVQSPDGYSAPSGQRLRIAVPEFQVPYISKLWIGRVDGSNAEIRRTFGAWVSHIGYWYEPSDHVWQFKSSISGFFEVDFYLYGGEATESIVLKEDFKSQIGVVGGRAASILRKSDYLTHPHGETIKLSIESDGNFQIQFRSLNVSARQVDAVSVKRRTLYDWVVGQGATQ